METADDQWVLASRRGDPAAFEKLVRRYGRWLYARLYLQVHDPHRVEDLVQETFLAAWKALDQLKDPADFRPWLGRIAQHTLVDVARREMRLKRGGTPAGGWKRQSEELVAHLPDAAGAPEEQAARHELRQRLLDALAELPEQYREPMTLRYLGGADYETIGKQLGLTNGSLRGLLARGMAMLRDRLAMSKWNMR